MRSYADPLLARRLDGAGVSIVAGSFVRLERTTDLTVTGVVRAWVPIVARCRRSRGARAFGAAVALGADVVVIAGLNVVCKLTAQRDIAAVGRAQVAIVAVHRGSLARAQCAHVLRGARISVVAGVRIRLEQTASCLIAGIIRARIAIVARRFGPRGTGTVGTCVSLGAYVSVIAGLRVILRHAADFEIAAVGRA